MDKLKAYWQLTKPRVMLGNVITGAAGFFLAAAGKIDWVLFLATIAGMTLVVSAACAINNYLDRDIDAKMERTKNRPSLSGVLSPLQMKSFATILLALGLILLAFFTNWLVVTIGIAGYVIYVWLYGAWSKRLSWHGTLVGSISGAMPIAGGYAAVSGSVDLGLILVFLALFFWQFPEFYSIAIYRQHEYAEAKIPIITVMKNNKVAAKWILFYAVLYVTTTLAIKMVVPAVGYTYLIIMTLAGAHLIYFAARGLRTNNIEAWAKKMFHYSIYNLMLFSILCSTAFLFP